MSNSFQPSTNTENKYSYQKQEQVPFLQVKPEKSFASEDVQLMWDILCYKRHHESEAEELFCKNYLSKFRTLFDASGKHQAYVYQADEQPILWSCHTDTVHSGDGFQTFDFDEEFNWFKAKGQPLGADNGAGIWMLLSLIKAGIGGTYVFHRGEEVGGIGSSFIAEHHSEWLKTFTHAIAFDRRGSTSVITHQGGTRCCSDEFADDFIAQVGMGFKKDTGGSFTDTKNYTKYISECTNISIGYASEHSQAETLDFEHCMALRDKLVEVFALGIHLVSKRTPGSYESLYNSNLYSSKYSSYYGDYAAYDFNNKRETEVYKRDSLTTYGYETENILDMTDKQIKEWALDSSHNEMVYVIQDLVSIINDLTGSSK